MARPERGGSGRKMRKTSRGRVGFLAAAAALRLTSFESKKIFFGTCTTQRGEGKRNEKEAETFVLRPLPSPSPPPLQMQQTRESKQLFASTGAIHKKENKFEIAASWDWGGKGHQLGMYCALR